MKVAILYSDEIRQYDFGIGHPFRASRFKIFIDFLRNNLPENDNYIIIESQPVTDEDLLLICTKDYIDFVKNFYEAAYHGITYTLEVFFNKFLSLDNIPGENPGNIEKSARLIVGQMKKACDLVQEGTYKKVVSIGGGLHHAKPSFGEGFCIYNDIAFGAKYLIEKHLLESILILDTDAHAGNGTMQYFYDDPKVLFIDIHQDPATIYPGTGFISQIGEGMGKGFTVNCPLPPGAGWDSYQYIFDNIVFPLAEEFKPQIIIRNGGTDPYWNDSLTYLGLTVSNFKKIGQCVREMSKICDGKVIDAIASGYNERAIAPGWLSLICGLADIELKIEEPEPVPNEYLKDYKLQDTMEMVKKLKKNLKDHWKCMC